MPSSQNCSLNAHRKSSRNVLGVFDVKNAERLFKLFWICSRGILSLILITCDQAFFFLREKGKLSAFFFSKTSGFLANLDVFPAFVSVKQKSRKSVCKLGFLGNFGHLYLHCGCFLRERNLEVNREFRFQQRVLLCLSKTTSTRCD